jgi:hypothetical protein
MTNTEKIDRLAVLIAPDTASNDLLLYLLEQSEGIILARRYPFGAPEGVTLSAMQEQIQLRIAVELFSKMGAEGQVAHDENGVKRTWEAADVSPSLLKHIIPVCGSVTL